MAPCFSEHACIHLFECLRRALRRQEAKKRSFGCAGENAAASFKSISLGLLVETIIISFSESDIVAFPAPKLQTLVPPTVI